jgi:antibiotic biosynthesis monooxygenase (ABM) superfamily enzyme
MRPRRSGPGRRAPSVPRPWLVRLATTLAAWLVAWVVVVALLSLLGDELGSLPLALRALAISGVLVALMANLVMPVLAQLAGRLVRDAPRHGSERFVGGHDTPAWDDERPYRKRR